MSLLTIKKPLPCHICDLCGSLEWAMPPSNPHSDFQAVSAPLVAVRWWPRDKFWTYETKYIPGTLETVWEFPWVLFSFFHSALLLSSLRSHVRNTSLTSGHDISCRLLMSLQNFLCESPFQSWSVSLDICHILPKPCCSVPPSPYSPDFSNFRAQVGVLCWRMLCKPHA